MSHIELTDEPCPDCGASLEVRVVPETIAPATDAQSPTQRETVHLMRIKICPDCGWMKTA